MTSDKQGVRTNHTWEIIPNIQVKFKQINVSRQISSWAIRYGNKEWASATDSHQEMRWEVRKYSSGGPEATLTKACHRDLNRSGDYSPYLRGSTSPTPLLSTLLSYLIKCCAQTPTVASDNQIMFSSHKARRHTLPWWSWMRGIVNSTKKKKKKKG